MNDVLFDMTKIDPDSLQYLRVIPKTISVKIR